MREVRAMGEAHARDVAPRGRPNEMEPALIDLVRQRAGAGVTMDEAARLLPHVASGRRTPRAMSSAALRLLGKGILVRREEWFRPEGNPGGIAKRYRYWHVDADVQAPPDLSPST